MAIRRLEEADAPAFARLRARAYASDPGAFAGTPEDDATLDPERVAARLVAGAASGSSLVLGAFEPELIGAVGVVREAPARFRHKARLWGLYVEPAARGRGLGARLVREAARTARHALGSERIHLRVAAESAAAIRLYARLGLRPFGREPAALRGAEGDVEELHMAAPAELVAGGGGGAGPPCVTVVSGPPGAGKSTLAALLAAAEPRAVHLELDAFFAALAHPVPPVRPESREQNAAVMRAGARAAAAFADAGYAVVLDGVVGPWLLPAVARELLGRARLEYLVLRLGLEASLERAAARRHPRVPPAVVRQMHAAFAALGALEGHALDATGLAPPALLAACRCRRAEGGLAVEPATLR